MSRQVATPGLARSRGATRVCSGEQTPGLISSPAIVPRQQEIDYENERKANLVSSQEIWLWLGAAVRVAGLGCHCGFCGIACHRGHALAARAFRPLDCGGYRLGDGHDYYLPGERRTTTLALGKGLAFAYDFASHSPGASPNIQPVAGPELRWTRQVKPLTTQSMKRDISQNCGSRCC